MGSNRTSISSIRHPREGLGEARDSPSDPASRFANWMARAVDPKTLCVLCAFAWTKLFRAKTQRRKDAKTQRHEERKSWIPAYRSEKHTSELQSLMRSSAAL